MARNNHTKLKKEKQKAEKVPKNPDAVVVQKGNKGGVKKKRKTKEQLIEERGIAASTSFDHAQIGDYFLFKSGQPTPRNGQYFVKNGIDTYLDGRVQYQVRSRSLGITLYVLA